MKIKEHKIIKSPGNNGHQLLVIDWFDRDWKVVINDNHIKQITTVHLWDESSKEWRQFAGRDIEESIVYDTIKNNKIAKLKYKVQ